MCGEQERAEKFKYSAEKQKRKSHTEFGPIWARTAALFLI